MKYVLLNFSRCFAPFPRKQQAFARLTRQHFPTNTIWQLERMFFAAHHLTLSTGMRTMRQHAICAMFEVMTFMSVFDLPAWPSVLTTFSVLIPQEWWVGIKPNLNDVHERVPKEGQKARTQQPNKAAPRPEPHLTCQDAKHDLFVHRFGGGSPYFDKWPSLQACDSRPAGGPAG